MAAYTETFWQLDLETKESQKQRSKIGRTILLNYVFKASKANAITNATSFHGGTEKAIDGSARLNELLEKRYF